MRMIIVNAIWKQFFEFSKFTVEENKRERYNRDDVEGLEVSYALSWSGRATSIPAFSEKNWMREVSCVLFARVLVDLW